METRRRLLAIGIAAPFMSTERHGANSISTFRLFSPNRRLEVALTSDLAGRLTYGISFDHRIVLVPSPLGLDLGTQGALSKALRIVRATRTSVDRRYPLVVGKARYARDHYNELELDLEEANSTKSRRKLHLTFRAYDDGAAFRYRVPLQPGLSHLSIKAELTGFHFPADYDCWGFKMGTFNKEHEGEFHPLRASIIRDSDLFDSPLVCHTGSVAFAIAQADLMNYAGVGLSGRSDGGLGVQVRLAPGLDDPDTAVQGRPGADLVSPWRVLMMADHPGRLIESDLITNLNPPSIIADTSWIKSGKYAWDWWSADIVSGVAQPGMNNATMERFIDFAAELHLQYMVIDAGWYVTVGDHMGGPGADVTRSIPEIHLPALIEYADRRNVGLFVWAHWKALDAQMDKALALYQQLGLKGIKIDFMDRDDQQMVDWYHRLLTKAARHRLLVDLHGAFPPTGMRRTYPNLLTQEGVMGAEYNKWSARITATHNVTLPFTRMLLGPMDYTPGGFRNVRPPDFVPRYTLPLAQTTRGHTLAMYVVYESPLQAVADTPDAYTGQTGVDFLTVVPSTWDETRFLAGEIGEFVVLARRSGTDWFVGAMTNEQARVLNVPLIFLGKGRFVAKTYADGDGPMAVTITERVVGCDDQIELQLAQSGGAAIHLQVLIHDHHG
jgi:alpha-glucosidase